MDEHLGRRTAGGLLCTRGGSIVLFRQENVDRSSKRCCSRPGCSSNSSSSKGKQPHCHSKDSASKTTQRSSTNVHSQDKTPKRAASAVSRSDERSSRKNGRHDMLSQERVIATRRNSPRGETSSSSQVNVPLNHRSNAAQHQPLSTRTDTASSSEPWVDALVDLDGYAGWDSDESPLDESILGQSSANRLLSDFRDSEAEFPETSRSYLLSSMARYQEILSDLVIPDRHGELRMDIDDMSYEELLALGERIGTVSTGLSEEELSKCLKRSLYMPNSVAKGDKNLNSCDAKCTICQEEFARHDWVGEMACQHLYHAVCIRQWLRLKNWCPVCKARAGPEP